MPFQDVNHRDSYRFQKLKPGFFFLGKQIQVLISLKIFKTLTNSKTILKNHQTSDFSHNLFSSTPTHPGDAIAATPGC